MWPSRMRLHQSRNLPRGHHEGQSKVLVETGSATIGCDTGKDCFCHVRTFNHRNLRSFKREFYRWIYSSCLTEERASLLSEMSNYFPGKTSCHRGSPRVDSCLPNSATNARANIWPHYEGRFYLVVFVRLEGVGGRGVGFLGCWWRDLTPCSCCDCHIVQMNVQWRSHAYYNFIIYIHRRNLLKTNI